MKIKLVNTSKHLCETCINSFAECIGKPIFSIDRNPVLSGKDADIVIECDQYSNKHKEYGGRKCSSCGYNGQDNKIDNRFCERCHKHC